HRVTSKSKPAIVAKTLGRTPGWCLWYKGGLKTVFWMSRRSRENFRRIDPTTVWHVWLADATVEPCGSSWLYFFETGENPIYVLRRLSPSSRHDKWTTTA